MGCSNYTVYCELFMFPHKHVALLPSLYIIIYNNYYSIIIIHIHKEDCDKLNLEQCADDSEHNYIAIE